MLQKPTTGLLRLHLRAQQSCMRQRAPAILISYIASNSGDGMLTLRHRFQSSPDILARTLIRSRKPQKQ